MKKIFLPILLCFSVISFSQTDVEIGKVYIKRAEKKFNEKNISEAVKSYTKAMNYIDLSQNSDVSIPKLGMLIFDGAQDYAKAKEFSKDYFRLVTDKTSTEYLDMLELYVDIVDKIEDGEAAYNAQTAQITQTNSQTVEKSKKDNSRKARAKKTKSSNRIASQNTVEKTNTVTNSSSSPQTILKKSVYNTQPEEEASERVKTAYTPRKLGGGYTPQELAEDRAYPETIVADRTYPFNENGIAVFEKSGKLGLINDQGRVFLYPEEYKDYIEYDGYVILKDRKDSPSKLYCFNSNINFGFVLPSVREFNSLSTTYGEVMKPRGNGVLVTYPNNSLDVLKFDLNRGEYIKRPPAQELIENLKTLGGEDMEFKIDYTSDLLKLKMGEDWVVLGSPLGGDIYPMFKSNYNIFGYAFNKTDGDADDGVTTSTEVRVMSHLGAFYEDKVQASTSKESWWLDRLSRPISSDKIKIKKYTGSSQIVEVSAGTYKVKSR